MSTPACGRDACVTIRRPRPRAARIAGPRATGLVVVHKRRYGVVALAAVGALLLILIARGPAARGRLVGGERHRWHLRVHDRGRVNEDRGHRLPAVACCGRGCDRGGARVAQLADDGEVDERGAAPARQPAAASAARRGRAH